MVELPFEYWNKLTSQVILISALLGGFSLTVLVLLLENQSNSKLMMSIFRIAAISTGNFLISIFASNKILLMTTPGYPFEVSNADLTRPRIFALITFFIGISCVLSIVALSGWTKSKRMGWFTLIIGSLSFVIIIMMIS